MADPIHPSRPQGRSAAITDSFSPGYSLKDATTGVPRSQSKFSVDEVMLVLELPLVETRYRGGSDGH